MSGKEDVFQGLTLGRFQDSKSLSKALNKHIKSKNVFFLCVGTERSTGDSFAPFVGTYLKEKGYTNVLGTIDDPVHAVNLDEKIKLIPEGKVVIAIDSCLGRLKNIGNINLNTGSLHAGAGVGKELTPVGDYHIAGVVNVSVDDADINLQVLSCTSLSVVLKMANTCVAAIEKAFPIENKRKLWKVN